MSSEPGSRRQQVIGRAQGAPFDARVVQTDDEIAVAVYGEIDLATCSRLWQVMEQAISLGPRLVLDLAGTTFIGATGVELIVRAHRRLGQRCDAVVIRSLRPDARRVLSITGVDQLVTIEDPTTIGSTPPRGEPMEKRRSDGSGKTLVTFRVPAEVQATTVCVVGEFNDWSVDAHCMERDDDAFIAVIPLMPGRAYRFRYILDGGRWQNDWGADAYVPNEFGGADSSSISATYRSVGNGSRETEELRVAVDHHVATFECCDHLT